METAIGPAVLECIRNALQAARLGQLGIKGDSSLRVSHSAAILFQPQVRQGAVRQHAGAVWIQFQSTAIADINEFSGCCQCMPSD